MITSVDKFIKEHIRFEQHWNKSIISMSDARWQSLNEDTWLDGITYAKGSQFKVFETKNFGWIVFHPDTLTSNGLRPNTRIIKY